MYTENKGPGEPQPDDSSHPSPSDSGSTLSINPATLGENGRVANTDMETMPKIFRRARDAQQAWAETDYSHRATYVRRMRDYILDHADEIAEVISTDNGKTRTDAMTTEVMPCTLACNWYGKHAGRVLAPRSMFAAMASLVFYWKRHSLHRVPLGVVGIISPWNYPLSIPFGEVIMGLMAGNAVILKVATATPRVGETIEKIVRAGGLPEGLFQHVVASGGAVSTALLENGVDKIFFTGSVPVGKSLMAAAAPTLTPLSLELGGNDPMLVLADADLELASNGAAWAGYQNAGQSCGGVERIYVHESVYEPFIDLLSRKTAALTHGADSQFNVDMGAMTTENQLNTVREHVQDALDKGATIAAQSRRFGSEEGWYHPATLLTGVDHSMRVMQEETFGPVLAVMKFSNVEEAVQLANDSDLALTSSIWSRNKAVARELALRLESGTTTINDHLYTHGMSEIPWGGWKLSGIGRTHGAAGLEEMTHLKVVNWDLMGGHKRNLWWYPLNETTYKAVKNAMHFGSPRSLSIYLRNTLALVPQLLKKMYTPWKP